MKTTKRKRISKELMMRYPLTPDECYQKDCAENGIPVFDGQLYSNK